MSTYDPNRDADMTTDWPANRPVPPPPVDDEGATAVVPRHTPTAPPPTSPVPPQSGYGQPAAPGWAPQATPPAAGGGWQPPQPPGQYPMPGYPAGPGTPPGKKKPWGLIAGAVALVAIVGAGAVFLVGGGSVNFGSDDNKSDTAASESTSSAAPSTTASEDSEGSSSSDSSSKGSSGSGSSSPTTSSAPVAGGSGSVEPSSLPTLLASVSELNERFEASLTPAAAVTNSPFSGMTVMPSNCAGALLPGIDYVYSTANYTGFAGQILTDDASGTKIMQAVISFNSETEATRFYNDQFTAWKGCNRTEITASGGGQHQTIKAGLATDSENTGTMLMWPDLSDSGRGCERGMTPRNNVIVDVRVCRQSKLGSSGWTLARDIGKKINGKR